MVCCVVLVDAPVLYDRECVWRCVLSYWPTLWDIVMPVVGELGWSYWLIGGKVREERKLAVDTGSVHMGTEVLLDTLSGDMLLCGALVVLAVVWFGVCFLGT